MARGFMGKMLMVNLSSNEIKDEELDEELADSGGASSCGDSSAECCKDYFELKLAESIYLQAKINVVFSQDARSQAIEKAMECTDGNKNKAADLLGLTLRSFRYRVDKLNTN